MTTKQAAGVLRQWLSLPFRPLTWLFRGRNRDKDLEKKLQYLSKEEVTVHSRMKRRTANWRKLARMIIIYSVVLEVNHAPIRSCRLAAEYTILLSGRPLWWRKGAPTRNDALNTVPLFLGLKRQRRHLCKKSHESAVVGTHRPAIILRAAVLPWIGVPNPYFSQEFESFRVVSTPLRLGTKTWHVFLKLGVFYLLHKTSRDRTLHTILPQTHNIFSDFFRWLSVMSLDSWKWTILSPTRMSTHIHTHRCICHNYICNIYHNFMCRSTIQHIYIEILTS